VSKYLQGSQFSCTNNSISIGLILSSLSNVHGFNFQENTDFPRKLMFLMRNPFRYICYLNCILILIFLVSFCLLLTFFNKHFLLMPSKRNDNPLDPGIILLLGNLYLYYFYFHRKSGVLFGNLLSGTPPF